jgi:methionine-rich copper-binding protein CopC
MRISKIWLITSLLAVFMAGCGGGNTPYGGGGPAPAGDTTAPTVASTNPGDTTTGIATNQKITATFSEAVAPASCTTATFTLKQGTTSVPGAVSCVGRNAIFAPTGNLTASTAYTATVTTGVKDLAGNAAVSHTWGFTTGTTTDTTAPTVSSTDPADTATGVLTNRNITATFSEAIDPATVTAATFTLNAVSTGPDCAFTPPDPDPCPAAGAPVEGSVSTSGSVATFVPTITLNTSDPTSIVNTYTATITTGVKDLAGNALAANKIWSFTTADSTASSAGPAPVSLGTAAGFAILTKSGVTDVPTSAISGDVGASPISGSAIGVTCAEVTGTIHSADAAGPLPCRVTDPSFLTTAVSDMEIAYTDAAGRTVPAAVTELGAGNISGLNLAPGLYKWGTGLTISAPGVTLTGGANDVWIFQVGVNLTVGNGAIVTLSGGALPQNVFWQVAGQATLGTTADFKGTILSKTLISLDTSAVLNGRALAQTAVTLKQNTVTKP